MAKFCLTRQAKEEFKKALKSRELNPFKLSEMTSDERRNALSKYVGKENAVEVNALFESKLLLKNQVTGYKTWVKKVGGITPDVRRDMLSRIENLKEALNPAEEKQFLEDLVSTRLKIDVTVDEAKNISKLTENVSKLREKASEDGVFKSETDRLEYGASKVAIENYVNDLKLKSKNISFKEQPIEKVVEGIKEIPGSLKSAVASFDNSMWGRQGIKTLLDLRTAPIWAKNFLKSWIDIGRQLTAKGNVFKSGDDAVMDSIRADIYSRPNAINGKYDAGGYGLSVLTEEAYPSSLPEKIPLLGRIYKASEVAYNGGALRLRADLADRLIRVAEKQGINTLDPAQAKSMGKLISSMTGRGSLGKADVLAKEINVLLFSVKFLKSNFDTLTAHSTDKNMTSFAKKEAGKNLLSIVASVASILFLAKLLDPESVDEDPRSTNFGKVKIWGHWTDITGGMAGLVTLASRLVPTLHDGKWSFWTKSSTGKYTDLLSGQYGGQTALDVFENFWEGKLAPVSGLVRDLWKGEDFSGERLTPLSTAERMLLPISVQNFEQLRKDPKSSNLMGSMILDALGLSTSTYTPKTNWDTSTSKELLQFKDKVGQDKFSEANDMFNAAYNNWLNTMTANEQYKKLSDEQKADTNTKAKEIIKEKVLTEYKFKPKKEKQTFKSKQEDKKLKKLLP